MKKLRELTAEIEILQWIGDMDMIPTGIFLDSRGVSEGALFAAIRGTRADGKEFIQDAVKNGARAIICEERPTNPFPGITYVVTANASAALGLVASSWYEHPSRRMKVIGITGTNGKTTIATLLYQLFEALGYPSGLLSTIRVSVHGDDEPATHTTPDALSIQRHLARMVEAGCTHAFMEVSSHALHQNRVSGVSFAGAVFSNLTRDHLDYHPTFAQYLQAKKSLFDALGKNGFALINLDDKNGRVMVQNCRSKISTYSIRTAAGFHARIVEQHVDGMQINLEGQELWVRFTGAFNASNLLAVYGAAMLLSQKSEEVIPLLSSLLPVEGRLETIPLGNRITGVVDYAHTPDALENVLSTLRNLKGSGRIITLFGAGGDRDKGKRPAMAEVACRLSDLVIVTSDNPRSEDPMTIIRDIQEGIPVGKRSVVISNADRREAIRTAFNLAKPGDIILVAGKGHETYQEIHGVKHHFDDREELAALITDKQKLKY